MKNIVKYISGSNSLQKLKLNIGFNNEIDDEGLMLMVKMFESWKENNHPL